VPALPPLLLLLLLLLVVLPHFLRLTCETWRRR
jgi:hypothetical protein